MFWCTIVSNTFVQKSNQIIISLLFQKTERKRKSKNVLVDGMQKPFEKERREIKHYEEWGGDSPLNP